MEEELDSSLRSIYSINLQTSSLRKSRIWCRQRDNLWVRESTYSCNLTLEQLTRISKDTTHSLQSLSLNQSLKAKNVSWNGWKSQSRIWRKRRQPETFQANGLLANKLKHEIRSTISKIAFLFNFSLFKIYDLRGFGFPGFWASQILGLPENKLLPF